MRPARGAAAATLAAVFLSVPFCHEARAEARMPCAELSLVLALDGSGSMTEAEFGLQTSATAAALQHPEVLEAIRAVGGIALATLIWSDSSSSIRQVDWELVTDAESAGRHAARLLALDRGLGGNTDMGRGIWAALDLLADPGNCATRRIVNVSGDGRETPSARGRTAISVAAARMRADAEGVTINGLAITDTDHGLRDWYERAVITGPGAFAMQVARMEDFGVAMRAKLVREIRGEPDLSFRAVPAGTFPRDSSKEVDLAAILPEGDAGAAPPPG